METFAFDSKKLEAAVKAGQTAAIVQQLRQRKGIAFDASLGDLKFITPSMAMDATQSELVTVSNAGIPWFLANWIDPKVISILVSPMMAAVIAGEAMKGDWVSETVMFLTAESVGETSAYGDYSNSGSSNVNLNFPQRQNFLFQSFMQYGQREMERAGLAKVDWATQQQQSNALVLMKALNSMYFFGVANLENYGLLNDPNLYPSLTAQYSWLSSSSATANTIYQDVVRMFTQLQGQSGGTVRLDSPMVFACSPQQAVALKYITQYNTNSVEVLLKQNFPNLRIETAVEYSTNAGQLMQLFCEELDGQRTMEASFSVKLMAHNMVVDSSSWRQKRTSGGYGTVIYRPNLVVSMIG